jgi:hypothetical protein
MAKKRVFAFDKHEQLVRTGNAVRLVESSFQPRPGKGRRGRGGGGELGGVGPVASVKTGDLGANIQIGEILDDAWEETDVRFYFRSAHLDFSVHCPVGAKILLLGSIIQSWNEDDEPPTPDEGAAHPRGMLINCVDFLAELSGVGDGKVLWAGHSANGGATVNWTGDGYGDGKILWKPEDGEELAYDAEECVEE